MGKPRIFHRHKPDPMILRVSRVLVSLDSTSLPEGLIDALVHSEALVHAEGLRIMDHIRLSDAMNVEVEMALAPLSLDVSCTCVPYAWTHIYIALVTNLDLTVPRACRFAIACDVNMKARYHVTVP